QIGDSRPRVERQLDEAQRYEPRTSEVRHIHATYLEAWKALLGGYQQIQAGLENSDQPKLAQGRLAMARWREGSRRGARDLRALRDRLDLQPGEITPS